MKAIKAIACAALLGVALTACSNQSQGGSGPGKTFTLAMDADPGNLFPYTATLAAASVVANFLYGSLVSIDSSGNPIPELAGSWKATTSQATFTLRPGITCSDGSPLTASDVADAINWVATPANASTFLGSNVTAGTTASGDNASRIVTVTVKTPNSFLIQNLGSLPIVCKKGLANPSSLANTADGAGLYKLTSAQPGVTYKLTRRSDYTWGPGTWSNNQPGLPDTVVLDVVKNNTTRANQLLTGTINAAIVTAPDAARLDAAKLFKAVYLADFGTLFFNEAPSHPTSKFAIRKAIVQALDLNQYGNVLASGDGKPMTSFRDWKDPEVCKEDTVTGNLPSTDIAAAKAALQSEGWIPGPDGIRVKNGQKLTLTYVFWTTPPPGGPAAAEYFQQQLKAVGIEVKLNGADGPGVNNALHTDAFDIFVTGWGVTLPTDMVPLFSGTPFAKQGANVGATNDPEYETLVAKANAIPGTDSCPIWNQAERTLIKNLDVVPWYDENTAVYGRGATFIPIYSAQFPWSIRLVAQ